jgi:hypothetical protein
MAERRNYILGKGELLAQNEKVKMGFDEGSDPYSFSEQRRYLAPQASQIAAQLSALPQVACPNDEAVAVLTLHPKYLSKSAYPGELLAQAGLRVVGSRAITLTPRKSHVKGEPAPRITSEMYVAASRSNFRRLAATIEHMASTNPAAADLIKVESLRVSSTQERIKPLAQPADTLLYEVILHAGENSFASDVLRGFQAYLRTLGVPVNLESRLDAPDLTFVPVRTSPEVMQTIAEFAFMRFAREMPHIREFWPIGHSASAGSQGFPVILPTGPSLDPTIRVAVFDGGVPNLPEISQWVRPHDVQPISSVITAGLRHGLAVTSALLFGSLEPGIAPPRPFAEIDHYRVVDNSSAADPQVALYPILRRILAVLRTETYDFINFSLGPATAIEDGDINPWTALIDPILSKGKTLATIAAGNGGESDALLGYNRIQPPSDCVNALSVGACHDDGTGWQRSPYSSVGHGRCPGIMKPDGVAFGGLLPDHPFNVIDSTNSTNTTGINGTSFAAPVVLRTAIGVRAQLGPTIEALAVKALLIHNCERTDAHSKAEVGWGRFKSDIQEIISSSNGSVHVLYQGLLDPKKFLRAQIPMPSTPINGNVTISATVCIATTTDSQHPLTYTRSGLEICFRRDRNNIPPGKVNPKSDSFFKRRIGSPEQQLRADAHQWETVRHAEKTMRGGSITAPCFDIHLNPRDEGHDTAGEEVPYAMVVSVSAPTVPDLFEQVFDRYRFVLEELRPRFELALQV